MQRLPLPLALRELLRHEDRAAAVVINAGAFIVAVCLIASLLAIAFMK